MYLLHHREQSDCFLSFHGSQIEILIMMHGSLISVTSWLIEVIMVIVMVLFDS